MVSIPVFPATVTVYPQAELELNYFLPKDVIGDDPFTPQVEPSEPADLGLLVTNVGGGTANDLAITTAQPQIVQNEKGLLDTFQIIGTQVGNQAETPSLTVNFGDIAPGQTADASFLLLSSLQGVFDNFTATFTHSDALGGQATSLITSVETHTLVHAGNFNYANSTGATDYLVDDNASAGDLANAIYFSDGTIASVNDGTNAASSPAGSSDQLTFQVTADVTSGWDYIQLPDPGAGTPCTRSSAPTEPPFRSMTRPGQPMSPSRPQVDRPSITSCTSSTTTAPARIFCTIDRLLRPHPRLPPSPPSPARRAAPIGSVDVTFSEPIDPSTFTTANLGLVLNGGANLSTLP